jgi:hypothetical protein
VEKIRRFTDQYPALVVKKVEFLSFHGSLVDKNRQYASRCLAGLVKAWSDRKMADTGRVRAVFHQLIHRVMHRFCG